MSVEKEKSLTFSPLNPGSGVDLDGLHPSSRKRILVVDDDPDMIVLLKQLFMTDGYNVSGALSGKEALAKLGDVNPSIILLDLLMPEMNGEKTFEEVRKIVDIPIVVLTAVTDKLEMVRLLKIGVDDFITKPFDSSELTARVNAVLRRSEKPTILHVLSFPAIDLFIDLETYEVTFKSARIQLTGKMFEVLALLARNAPKVVNYPDLTTHVWGENTSSVRNRLKYLIYLLRQEFLKIDPDVDIIENIDRLGYRLVSGK
jgi:DNA-binding response OmpR family regulator